MHWRCNRRIGPNSEFSALEFDSSTSIRKMKIIRYTYSGLESAQETPDSDLQQHEQTPESYRPPRHMYLESCQCNGSPPLTYTGDYSKPEPGQPYDHCTAAPLFDVASVRIESNQFKGLNSIKIYGTILLIDDHGNEFYIFDCKHRRDARTHILDPATSPPCVILENFQPRGVPSKFCLLFQLKRRLRGAAKKDIVIFDDYKYIDCTKEVLYDIPQSRVFDDGQSIITVTCTIFQCVLLAEVGIVVEKTDENDQSGVATITGNIVAQTRGLSNDMPPHVRTLLAASSDKFKCGHYIPLSTLVVPAYSELEFHSLLNVNGDDLVCDLIFEPVTIDNLFHEKQIGRRPFRIRVIVYWLQSATSLTEANILEYYAKASETSFTDQRPTSKILKTNNAHYIQPVVIQYFADMKWDINDFLPEVLEIFSISVRAYDQGDSEFSLRGKVKCFDCRGRLYIFDSDTEGVSTSGNIVKLVPDLGRGFVGPYLGIETDLTDNQGREISIGCVTYNYRKIGDWCDMRICSVIRGENGFAAVHYSIFSNAVLAKLSFEVVNNFESGGATGCEVHGSINTSYSNFNYFTHYAKKYYRSTLFEKQKSDAVMLAGGEKIPLSKSVVAVPLYGLLMVEAIIYARNGKHREEFKFKESFSPAKYHDKIEKSRKSFGLNMNVEWVRDIPLTPLI